MEEFRQKLLDNHNGSFGSKLRLFPFSFGFPECVSKASRAKRKKMKGILRPGSARFYEVYLKRIPNVEKCFSR